MSASGARAALAVAALVGLGSTLAAAQPFNIERPLVVVSGTPHGGARMARIDASRRGMTRSPLPESGLHSEWRTALGFVAQQGPLVDSLGRSYVVGESGEVVALARDGAVLSRVLTRGSQPGPAALLSDDTVVFVDGAGEAVAVRDGSVVWRSRFGRASGAHAAPLALDDGGVVVASGPDLAVLDAGGRERARIVLPEPSSHPLLSALGRVVVVSDTGTVWSWAPGAIHVERVADFGSDIDGSAALVDDHTLIAVAESQTRLMTVDLTRRTVVKVAGPLGGLWLGSPAVDVGGVVCATQITPGGEVAVVIDVSGVERGRALLDGPGRGLGPGKDSPRTGMGSQTPPIIDGNGLLAFATAGGSIGIVSGLVATTDVATGRNAPVELLADACAPSLRRTPAEAAVVGMAPLAPSELVAVCRSGLVVAVKAGRTAGDSGAPRL
jgi:hypothetical protein